MIAASKLLQYSFNSEFHCLDFPLTSAKYVRFLQELVLFVSSQFFAKVKDMVTLYIIIHGIVPEFQ